MEPVGSGGGTRLGLGYAPARAKGRGDRGDKRSKYKALTSTDEEGEENIVYGTLDGSKFKVARLSPRGRPGLTGEIIDVCPGDRISELLCGGGRESSADSHSVARWALNT